MTNDKIEEVKKEAKFILIKKKKYCEEYTVWNKRKDFLGDIAKIKKKFVFYPDSIICKKYIWFRGDCLREIACFLDWVNGEQHEEYKKEINDLKENELIKLRELDNYYKKQTSKKVEEFENKFRIAYNKGEIKYTHLKLFQKWKEEIFTPESIDNYNKKEAKYNFNEKNILQNHIPQREKNDTDASNSEHLELSPEEDLFDELKKAKERIDKGEYLTEKEFFKEHKCKKFTKKEVKE